MPYPWQTLIPVSAVNLAGVQERAELHRISPNAPGGLGEHARFRGLAAAHSLPEERAASW